jgi:hypothetical protein
VPAALPSPASFTTMVAAGADVEARSSEVIRVFRTRSR